MNCFDFRRVVRADPGAWDRELMEHARGCQGCDAYWQQQRAMNRELREAMKVPAPASLADRIIFAHAARPRARWRRPAIAAAVAVFALAVGVLAYQPVSLAAQVTGHIEKEHLERYPSDPGAAAQFPRMVSDLGGTVRNVPPHLLQAVICQTDDGRLGLHLILAEAGGPVTVFVLPHDAPRVRVPIHAGALKGWLIPSGRSGIAVLAERDVDADAYARLMGDAIHWPA